MGSLAIEVTLVLLEFCNFLISMQQPSQFLVLCILDNEKTNTTLSKQFQNLIEKL